MQGIAWRRFAVGAALCVLPVVADAQSLDPLTFRRAVEAAKQYAADRTLVFYCIRQSTEMKPFTYMILHMELEEALRRMKSAGSNAQQNAEIAQAVMANTKFASTDDKNAALDTECTAKDVENQYYRFNDGFSVALASRPPFSTMPQ